jgi:predicted RNA-binding protein with PUA-like domain
MKYWLLKTEPQSYSWEQLVKDKVTNWSGVRSPAGRANLIKMKKGDRAFFYHTGDERQVVGVCEVVKESYPDPSDETGKFVQVDVRAIAPVPHPVTLAAIKAEPKLADMRLVREGRLSVSPVTTEEWHLVGQMAGMKA